MANLPSEPGYYWAKLMTPHMEPEGEDWASVGWELVQVNDNNGEGDEAFSVNVFGIPVTQWPIDFFWGPKVDLTPPTTAKEQSNA